MSAVEKDAVAGSVEKSFALVQELATVPGPHRLGDLATRTAMTKPTVHRLLRGLVAMGYARSLGSGQYTVGPAMIGVAAAALGGIRERPLIQRTLDELHTRTGLTASYAMRWEDAVVVIDNVEPDQAYRISPRLGVPVPIGDSPAGIALLAQDAPGRTSPPIELADAIDQVRRDGYAYGTGAQHGVCSVAAAVAFGDNSTGALLVTGLSFNLNAEAAGVIGPLVAEQAGVLSATAQAALPLGNADGIA